MKEFYPQQHVSVIMPVYNQASFISRAIESLLHQTFGYWELIIVNDGSTDNLNDSLAPYMADERIRIAGHEENRGLGYALNVGLALARYGLIAYLPADDVYHKIHLESLVPTFSDPAHILAYSGLRHHYNRSAVGQLDGYPLQLVQVMHRKTEQKWLERSALVTDDLGRMYWNTLAKEGNFTGTGKVTCEWVDHPHQRHKIIQEPIGGINPYKLYYNVKEPLRYHSTVGNFIDEVAYFEQFRNRPSTPPAKNGLKIVLLGELAYNSERVLALEEQGHELYGLWMKDPYWYNSVGPLPFGHVTDIPHDNWQETLKSIQPDVIYGLLNWQAVPFAHEVLTQNPGIPFVWHFKEGPFICLEKGTWRELIDLYTRSDGQIYSSPEMRDWFAQFIPVNSATTHVLDGDLPKKEFFKEELSELLSLRDGEIHTVVPGRPIGLHPHTVAELASYKIHLHFYGDFTHGQWKEWIKKTESMAPGYLHIHPNCTQENWVREFSKYDAGWLHFFRSENQGELMKANWDDLNYPARMATLAVAGLPMLQRNNEGHIVATQNLVKKLGVGLFFDDMKELSDQLHNRQLMESIRNNVWKHRFEFSFDHHATGLAEFFRMIIARKNQPASTVHLVA